VSTKHLHSKPCRKWLITGSATLEHSQQKEHSVHLGPYISMYHLYEDPVHQGQTGHTTWRHALEHGTLRRSHTYQVGSGGRTNPSQAGWDDPCQFLIRITWLSVDCILLRVCSRWPLSFTHSIFYILLVIGSHGLICFAGPIHHFCNLLISPWKIPLGSHVAFDLLQHQFYYCIHIHRLHRCTPADQLGP